MPNNRPVSLVHFVHTLLRARDWQERPEFTQVCDWWRVGGKGVLALVGIGGAGKTAIADRFVRSLPGVTEPEPYLPQDTTLSVPEGLFVFSFYDAPNPEHFFDALYDWLVTEFQIADRRRVTDTGVRIQASASLVIDVLGHIRRKLLLILDGLEKVQDDGSRSSMFGHIENGGLREFLRRTASGLLPGLTVLVTTRFVLDDLDYERERGTAPHFELMSVDEISDVAGIALLRHRGVRGGDDILRAISRACGQHALTIDLIGGYLVHFHNGDPDAPLDLPTPEELQRLAACERDHRLRHFAEQTARLHHVAERYHAALAQSEPAALALLQRLCLFRLGVDATMLTSIFTGPGKETISGPALAALSSAEVQAKLTLLVDMRLIECSMRDGTQPLRTVPATIYTVHPAVRDGFLRGLAPEAVRCGHDAASVGLLASLGDQPSTNPSDPTTLDLLEEIVYHTLHAGHVADAWDIYWNRIGSYQNLLWRLGAYERGERICRAFAGGLSPQAALGSDIATTPFRKLSERRQPLCINEWALYLMHLGRLDAAARCYEYNIQVRMQQEDWKNAAIGNQTLAEVWLLSGRLTAGLLATAKALCLAERANDAEARQHSYAYRGYALAQQGETAAALTDFHDALHWQHQYDGQADPPLYSNRGVWHALLLIRLGHHAESMQLTEANKEILLEYWGAQDFEVPKCHIILADLARERGDWGAARDLCQQAYAWALERDAKEVLCWSALVQARIEMDEASAVIRAQSDRTTFQPLNDHIVVCRHALANGLRIARECGYGIYHIDLLLVQAQLALLTGDADAALVDIDTALTTGHHPPANAGLPTLLAATDPTCGYAWGEAEARRLRAEAILLQAARDLGHPDFVPANLNQLPTEVRRYINEAREELQRCRALRQRLQDPKVRQTDDVLNRLNGGELTQYPLTTLQQMADEVSPITANEQIDQMPVGTAHPIASLRRAAFMADSTHHDTLGLQKIAGCDNPQRVADIVFIHGLGGGASTTWMADGQQELFWPLWVAEDFRDAGVWTLGYAASASKWREESMPLADRGNAVLEQHYRDGLGDRSLIFITHSLGGIVVKQFLRHAESFGVPRWEAIVRQTKGIAFIATPHSGANIANFVEFAKAVLRTNEHVGELAAHYSRLRELHGWFLNFSQKHQLRCRTYCETREVRPEIPFLGIRLPKGILVVDETSAEPNIPRERAIPLDEDHISICKPRSRDTDLYKSIRRFLQECLPAGSRPQAMLVSSSPLVPVPQQANAQSKETSMLKTIVELDLVGYSTIAEQLEQGLDVETVQELNIQIQAFINQGLSTVNVSRADHVMQTTGDGAILVFDHLADAHRFAEAVQAATREHNKTKTQPIGKRVFRIGAATGDIVMQLNPEGGYYLAGIAIARAVRLEAQAHPGEIVVDEATFDGLTADQQQHYAVMEVIPGKRKEQFNGYRCLLNPDATADVSCFVERHRQVEPPNRQPPIPRQDARDTRREILRLFQQLKSHQYDDLVFLLNIPISRRPSNLLTLEERKSNVLKWAEEERKLDDLVSELRELVASETRP